MQDNFTNDLTEILIKYMDGELSPAEQEAIEKLLQNDMSLQERYQQLLAAKKAIRSLGVKKRVLAIHEEYLQQTSLENKPAMNKVKRFSFYKSMMSAAAVLILVIAGYGVFEYTNTTRQLVYDDAYLAYHLPLSRGEEQKESIDKLYGEGDYSAVIKALAAKEKKTQKDYFIAGQSYLRLNDATHAIAAFQQVEILNNGSADKYFVQETDYYLTLAYVKANEIDSAEVQLDKIVADKNHLFYAQAKEISRTKLMILKMKGK